MDYKGIEQQLKKITITFSFLNIEPKFGLWLDKQQGKQLVEWFRRVEENIEHLQNTIASSQDKNDTCKVTREHIKHYKASDRFRVHGYNISNVFYVIRIDPKHKYHGS